MNLAEAAVRLGNELKNIEDGKEILEVYRDLKENTSSGSWNMFSKSLLRAGLNNYLCFNFAYDLIQDNKNNAQLPDYMRRDIDSILSEPNFNRLYDLSKVMKKGLDTLVKEILMNNLPASFNGVKIKPKTKRAIQDFSIMYQRTGIIKSFIKIASPLKSTFKKVSEEYEREKDAFPFSSTNLKLISELEKKGESKSLLYYLESFNSFNLFINQLIFEAHMEIITSIRNNEVKRFNIKPFNGMILFRLISTNFTLDREGCIIELNYGADVYYGIINKQLTYFDNEEQVLEGFLYPLVDKSIFPESL